MRKILILTPFYPPNIGGAETFVMQLVNSAKKWFNIDVLTFQPFNKKAPKYESYYTKNGYAKIFRMNWIMRHGRVWQGFGIMNVLYVFPKMLWCAYWKCQFNNYDVIHAQGFISALVGVFLKKYFGGKLYLTILALYDFNDRTKILKAVVRFILRNCDYIFVEGENGKKDLSHVYKNITIFSERVVVFNHWCDQNVFKPPVKREDDRIRILFVGRPIKEKGMHIVKEAERKLNNPKLEFIYVTDVEYKDLPKYYKMAHVVVVPSLYSEGFSRVVAEASCCGCAIITSDKGSLPEMVKGYGISTKPEVVHMMPYIKGIDYISGGIISYEYAKENYSEKNAEVFLERYAQ